MGPHLVRNSIFNCLIWAFARPLLYGSAAAVLSASISHNSIRAKHAGRRYGIVMRRCPTDPAFQYCRGRMPPCCRPFRKCVADAAGRARRCQKYRPHSMLPRIEIRGTPVVPRSGSRFRLNADNDRYAGVAVFLLDDEETAETSGASVLLSERL